MDSGILSQRHNNRLERITGPKVEATQVCEPEWLHLWSNRLPERRIAICRKRFWPQDNLAGINLTCCAEFYTLMTYRVRCSHPDEPTFFILKGGICENHKNPHRQFPGDRIVCVR